MKKPLLLLFLGTTLSLFSHAQCIITVKPNSEGLTSYTGDKITVAKAFNNKVTLSMNALVDQSKKGYTVDISIATTANEKVSITPNYIKIRFVNKASVEFSRDAIKTTIKDHTKTQEVHFQLPDSKLKLFTKTLISDIRIVDASAHVFKIGGSQSKAVQAVAACVSKSANSKTVKLVNLTM